MLDRYYTVAHAAERLDCAASTVRGWIAQGRLAAVRLGEGRGADVRIAETELRRFLGLGPEQERQERERVVVARTLGELRRKAA